VHIYFQSPFPEDAQHPFKQITFILYRYKRHTARPDLRGKETLEILLVYLTGYEYLKKIYFFF
jgi:hypothetical protein